MNNFIQACSILISNDKTCDKIAKNKEWGHFHAASRLLYRMTDWNNNVREDYSD